MLSGAELMAAARRWIARRGQVRSEHAQTDDHQAMERSPGDHWEAEVFSRPPLVSLERTPDSVAFDWLGRRFPSAGGKIAWDRVTGRHQHWRIEDEKLLVERACAEIRERVTPGSTVEHVGDGLSPYGVRFAGEQAVAVTAALLEVPEHHYFLAGDRTWIVVVAFEGDLDVLDLDTE